MILTFFIIKIFFLNFINAKTSNLDAAIRDIKNAEKLLMTGGKLNLNAQERLANDIIIKHKLKEIQKGMSNPESYAPSLHFFKAKELIKHSKNFQFIKWLPKGSLLHGHSKSLVSSEWIIKNITYHSNIMKCKDKNGVILFKFETNPKQNCIRIVEERKKAKNIELYDKELEKNINLYTRYPEMEYSDISIVWSKFQNMFSTLNDIFKYLPTFKIFFTQILEEAYNDGIMYLEIRTSIKSTYDDSGKVYDMIETAQILKNINDEFKVTHKNFIGYKLIYSVGRHLKPSDLLKKIKDFKKLYAAFPDFIIGFDIVGQEINSLNEFVESIQTLPAGVKFFFHAGETNWYGTSIDYNLLDAMLLNTTRIGHGYALLKHPVLWNSIKNRDIAIEINPLSNQILRLVNDLRNHPAAFYISENIPIVISNDDPGFWNAKGLSYDFYYAFMSFTPADAGIKVLKQLVLNSIKYSVMTSDERQKAMEVFQKQWSVFLTKVISENRNT